MIKLRITSIVIYFFRRYKLLSIEAISTYLRLVSPIIELSSSRSRIDFVITLANEAIYDKSIRSKLSIILDFNKA